MAGGGRCRQDNLGSISQAGQGLHRLCSPKSRTLCTRHQPFVSRDNEDVGWLECCLYHTLSILWNDTFWIYTIQAIISMKSRLQLQLEGLDGVVGDSLLLVQEGVGGRRPASLLLLHHAAVPSCNGSPFCIEWIFKNRVLDV